MITAIDSSVLWAIINDEPAAERWLEALVNAATDGLLVICPVTFSELAPSTGNASDLLSYLEKLSITYDPISTESAYHAGSVFKQYRKAGGPRQHLIPDFLIAAHARIQANRLAAIDRGYLRIWFSDLTLLQPI